METGTLHGITAAEPLDRRGLRILIASTYDLGGGAEISAWNLFKACRDRGHDAWLAAGYKRSDNRHVLSILNAESRSLWARLWLGFANHLGSALHDPKKIDRLNAFVRAISEPRRWLEKELGHEDYDYPGTRRLLDLCDTPDILHCYNLHGGYFDLRVLPWLSRQLPVVLDLRDAWLLSGHCAHSFGCERWKIGCGNCPDLNIYPKVRRDATAYNWQRKRAIYAKSRLYVSTPCQWLMERVEQSILSPAVIESRVIPTGVDQTVFHAADKAAARAALNLPQDVTVLLFAANGIRHNMWKDYNTLRAAIERVGERLRGTRTLFLALGENSTPERLGDVEVRFIPFQRNFAAVASYYQAADLYVHSARVETFPRAVLEALSCGVPVVATAVGGITEQVKGVRREAFRDVRLNRYEAEEATGVLVAPEDSEAMALAIEELLKNDLLRFRMGENAAKDAKERFGLLRQVSQYLEWYEEILHNNRQDQKTMSCAQ